MAKIEKDVTERVKTFEDACRELGKNHPYVLQYNTLRDYGANGVDCADVVAYLKLRIIAAALNEGWQPKFTTNERRYSPYFYLYTQEEADVMGEGSKSLEEFRPDYNTNAYSGIAVLNTAFVSTSSADDFGSRLVFKTRELAEYAGKNFFDIWTDYLLK